MNEDYFLRSEILDTFRPFGLVRTNSRLPYSGTFHQNTTLRCSDKRQDALYEQNSTNTTHHLTKFVLLFYCAKNQNKFPA
jgi:hypothetical protein